jgi:ABC-2 type transport system ATP-binding protein
MPTGPRPGRKKTSPSAGVDGSRPSRPPGVVVRGLKVRYGLVAAVSGVDFQVAQGEVFGLLGPNGAGKSTIIDAIAGLRAPSGGSIEVCGLDLALRPRDAKRRIGVAMQTTGLPGAITPAEALGAFGQLYGRAAPVGELQQRFGLEAISRARVSTLSGGQRQRLALALAFVNDPDLIVLDEPTSGLDPISRRELHSYIAGMRREGRAVLIATHDMDEAYKLCDRVAVLNKGRIVAEGAPGALVAQAAGEIHVEVQSSEPVEADWLAADPLFDDLRIDGASLSFATPDLAAALSRLLAILAQRQVEVIGLRAARAGLEDVIAGLANTPPVD